MNSRNPLFDENDWIETQIRRYGPVVGGEALRSFLGFRTATAFQKARLQGEMGIAVFGLPGRQGLFAVTEEACAWVLAQRRRLGSTEPAGSAEAPALDCPATGNEPSGAVHRRGSPSDGGAAMKP